MPSLLVKLTRAKIPLSQKNGKEKGNKRNMSQAKKPAFVTMRWRSSARNATDLFMRLERAKRIKLKLPDRSELFS